MDSRRSSLKKFTKAATTVTNQSQSFLQENHYMRSTSRNSKNHDNSTKLTKHHASSQFIIGKGKTTKRSIDLMKYDYASFKK